MIAVGKLNGGPLRQVQWSWLFLSLSEHAQRIIQPEKIRCHLMKQIKPLARTDSNLQNLTRGALPGYIQQSLPALPVLRGGIALVVFIWS